MNLAAVIGHLAAVIVVAVAQLPYTGEKHFVVENLLSDEASIFAIMQGRKELSPKLLYTTTIDQLVPKDNYYRKLNQYLDLKWLYAATAKYYGREGQESIDPVVFFKMCLVGYLNGITSDRKLAEECSMRLDVRLFLGYDIDEPLPWHSTISRTRGLYGEDVFAKVFDDVVKLCVEKGMVSGQSQAIDSALMKANASLDSIEAKRVDVSVGAHLEKCLSINSEPRRKAKVDRAEQSDKQMSGTGEQQKVKLNELQSRNKRYQAPDLKQGNKHLSNSTHYSPVDPDARIALKTGKPRNLYYSGQMAVDTSHHVITHMEACHAESKDSKHLPQVVEKMQQRLNKEGLVVKNILADGAYASGENYQYLQQQNITAYVPLRRGSDSDEPGFTYDKEKDIYLCPNEKILKKTKKPRLKSGYLIIEYRASIKDCRHCPVKDKCLGKAQSKRLTRSFYKEHLDAAKKRSNSAIGKIMAKRRSSTVEPVWGTLINFLGLRQINVRGLKKANKVMLMAATVYNLKKLLRYVHRRINCKVVALGGQLRALHRTAFYDLLARL